MKIGILGGTFDPVHFGHLRTAEEVGENFGLEKVYLIPSNKPPHKKRRQVTGFNERLTMLKYAIEDSEILDVLDIEGKRGGYSYTIDTLRELSSESWFGKDADMYFIIGIDAFGEIDTWKDYKRLFKYANFIVVKRPGYSGLEEVIKKIKIPYVKKEGDIIELATGKNLYLTSVTYMDISSTKIRELIRKGKSISFLLPEKVKDYILKKKLYRGDEGNR